MRKRIFAGILALATVTVMLCGCGSEKQTSNKTNQNTTETEPATVNVDYVEDEVSIERKDVAVADDNLKILVEKLNNVQLNKGDTVDLSALKLDSKLDEGFDNLLIGLGDDLVSYDETSKKLTALSKVIYKISYTDKEIVIYSSTK